MKTTMDTLVNYAKNYGFVFQGSEIYGGLANTWDYGPLGTELKTNIKNLWWRRFVQENPLVVGIDSAILMNPKTWEASGHVENFNDPLIDCKNCKSRHRADHLVEAHDPSIKADALSEKELEAYLGEHGVPCPDCGAKDFTAIRRFNLMFETDLGVTAEKRTPIYLRPETAQGIFLNFKNVQRTSRMKVPFGIAQTGKSFRNEITPKNFIFRTREFEQLELEFFVKPGTEKKWFDHWRKASFDFLVDIGLREENLRLADHDESQLSHYSDQTTDIEYRYPFGFDELWGIASRTDFDLAQHEEHAKTSLAYHDPETNEKYLPFVIEPSLGVDRLFLAVLADAYTEEELDNSETRTCLKIHPALAPYKVAILPLIKKRHREKALELQKTLAKHFLVFYDESGKIGRRYRRQDAIGTPLCVTVDDEGEEEGYTIRERDSMEQVRVKEEDLVEYIGKHVRF